jgi:hypothetical protein
MLQRQSDCVVRLYACHDKGTDVDDVIGEELELLRRLGRGRDPKFTVCGELSASLYLQRNGI